MTQRAIETSAQFLAKLDPKARGMIECIRKILKSRPRLVESVGSMAGSSFIRFTVDGQYAYGLASRKDGIRFYSMSMYAHPQLKKKYATSLGIYLVGKSCMRFRKLEEIDARVLQHFVADVAKIQGVRL